MSASHDLQHYAKEYQRSALYITFCYARHGCTVSAFHKKVKLKVRTRVTKCITPLCCERHQNGRREIDCQFPFRGVRNMLFVRFTMPVFLKPVPALHTMLSVFSFFCDLSLGWVDAYSVFTTLFVIAASSAV